VHPWRTYRTRWPQGASSAWCGIPQRAGLEQVDTARERVIQARPSHLDSLVRRLREPEVQRVLLLVLAGSEQPADLEYSDDLSFVRDLGLITDADAEGPRIANHIYAEVISRSGC
jgi:hypothetical protein